MTNCEMWLMDNQTITPIEGGYEAYRESLLKDMEFVGMQEECEEQSDDENDDEPTKKEKEEEKKEAVVINDEDVVAAAFAAMTEKKHKKKHHHHHKESKSKQIVCQQNREFHRIKYARKGWSLRALSKNSRIRIIRINEILYLL